MFQTFKQDVQRWVIPQQIADPSIITLGLTLKLLWRHLPLQAMLLYRLGSWSRQRGVRVLPGIIQRLIHFIYGLELASNTTIGGGLYIAHPIGTVIYAEQIGRNCSIIAAVTVGMRNEWTFPIIGDGVFVGAGARVLGGIEVGDDAVIGANAVVINDVPTGATVVGIPARVIKTMDDGDPVLYQGD